MQNSMSRMFRNVSSSILFFTPSLSLTYTSAVLCQFGSTISLTSRRFSIVCMTPSAFTTPSFGGHPLRSSEALNERSSHPHKYYESNTLCLCRVNINFPSALIHSLQEARSLLIPSLLLSFSLSLVRRVVDLPGLTLLESFPNFLHGWVLPLGVFCSLPELNRKLA